MQITIPQVEIEKAITDYIQTMVQIGDGMQIDIDLRATRGVEGFQAIIDIYPQEMVKTPAPTPAPAAKAETKAEPKNEPQTEAKAEPKPRAKPLKISDEVITAEAILEAAPEAEAEPTPVEAEAEPVPAPTNTLFKKAPPKVEEAPVEEATEAPRSIFGDLKKPVNNAAA